MLSSISPVGEQARQQRWGLTVTAYLLGSVVAGMVTGGLAGGIGQVALTGVAVEVRLALVGILALSGLVLDATVGVPSRNRQVDVRWLTRYRGWVYGGGFGLQLGTGVATIIPSSVVYATWGGALLTASLPLGAVAGAAFGLARGLPLVLAGRIRTVSGLRRTLAGMDRARPRVARVVPAGQLLVGLATLILAGVVLGS